MGDAEKPDASSRSGNARKGSVRGRSDITWMRASRRLIAPRPPIPRHARSRSRHQHRLRRGFRLLRRDPAARDPDPVRRRAPQGGGGAGLFAPAAVHARHQRPVRRVPGPHRGRPPDRAEHRRPGSRAQPGADVRGVQPGHLEGVRDADLPGPYHHPCEGRALLHRGRPPEAGAVLPVGPARRPRVGAHRLSPHDGPAESPRVRDPGRGGGHPPHGVGRDGGSGVERVGGGARRRLPSRGGRLHLLGARLPVPGETR